MANIKKYLDNSIKPYNPKDGKAINYTDLAFEDHEYDTDIDSLMRFLLTSDMPIEYKIARCELIVEQFKSGIQLFKEEGNG